MHNLYDNSSQDSNTLIMADIKTMTQELTTMSVDIEEAMLGGDYQEVVAILKKIIEKLDEVVEKVNE
mgnify:CR=1 FL=1